MRSPRRAWIALDTPSPEPARVAAEGPGRPPLLAPSGDGGGAGEMWKPWGINLFYMGPVEYSTFFFRSENGTKKFKNKRNKNSECRQYGDILCEKTKSKFVLFKTQQKRQMCGSRCDKQSTFSKLEYLSDLLFFCSLEFFKHVFQAGKFQQYLHLGIFFQFSLSLHMLILNFF
jgi:hypothetical protein